jgi:muramoyltetrapeptide carboxypeptidase
MIQPQNLQPGDLIGIVCPAGSIPMERVQKCVETLTQWGYQVKLGATVGSKNNSFSATDAERALDLQQMLDDSSVKAILCGRGGYGVSRIIHDIDFTGFQKQPKWVIGFSDITVLHAALQKTGIASIHGPMAAAFNKGDEGATYIQALKTLLEGGKTVYTTTPHAFNKIGSATAPIVGGNLCMMAHLIGSAHSFDTAGKLLFMEDIGEYHYNLDRLMIQMKQAGMFEKIAGLIVGGFTEMKDPSTDFGSTANEIIQSHVKEYAYPICYDFPISHATNNYPVIEGGNYTLSVTDDEVSLALH